MKIRAEKLGDGNYKLFLESRVELPVIYSEEDLETLEENGVISNRCSYYGGMEINFRLKKESIDKIESAILDAITENRGANNL